MYTEEEYEVQLNKTPGYDISTMKEWIYARKNNGRRTLTIKDIHINKSKKGTNIEVTTYEMPYTRYKVNEFFRLYRPVIKIVEAEKLKLLLTYKCSRSTGLGSPNLE